MKSNLNVPTLVGILTIITISTLAVNASAEAILLSTLIEDDGTITNGDKEFSDFGYAATGDMPSSDRVNVIAIEDAEGNYGVRFQGGFVDLPGDGASDALIYYNVKVTNESNAISEAHLAANIVSPEGSSGTITETFLPIFDSTDEILRIPTNDSRLNAGIVFPETVQEMQVQKNILFIAAEGEQVDMSFVDQTFSQVPEPSSICILFLLGSASALIWLRR
ncbi:MAG: hypothetical protein P8N76_26770 [Pirellulaceae bacterium]|nr:hypothetical protein [Pirellulaceae bacterium]